MKLSEIPELEQAAITYLIEADGVPEELRAQIESVRTVVRSESSVGVYVDFDLDREAPLPAGEVRRLLLEALSSMEKLGWERHSWSHPRRQRRH